MGAGSSFKTPLSHCLDEPYSVLSSVLTVLEVSVGGNIGGVIEDLEETDSDLEPDSTPNPKADGLEDVIESFLFFTGTGVNCIAEGTLKCEPVTGGNVVVRLLLLLPLRFPPAEVGTRKEFRYGLCIV